MVFSVFLKNGFHPMLMTILKTPRVDNLAQPKYTPVGCNERRSKCPLVDKLAENQIKPIRTKNENVLSCLT